MPTQQTTSRLSSMVNIRTCFAPIWSMVPLASHAILSVTKRRLGCSPRCCVCTAGSISGSLQVWVGAVCSRSFNDTDQDLSSAGNLT